MKLKLHITTKPTNKVTEHRKELTFTVIDLDKAKSYPENFVCILPKLTPNTKTTTTFISTFGNESLQVAKKLLTTALRNEDEPVIRDEIKKRLNALQPKPSPEAKCTHCGNTFKPKTFGRYQQKICPTCKNKSANI